MLQQTQVQRVIPKYHEFLEYFPHALSLAQASLGDVLRVWSGLGYNRRAKYLHDAAQTLTERAGSWNYEALVACRGIGPNTAAAVVVYSYNQPRIFIETNIRTAFIHYFFADVVSVKDAAILEKVHTTLDVKEPRQWFWALMDYGAYLKKTHGNLNKLSKSYTKQSPFQGSKRQIRGTVIRLLAVAPQTFGQLEKQIPDTRLDAVLGELINESLIQQDGASYRLA